MGRLTAVEKASRMDAYNIIVWKMFLNDGWDGVTYKNVADKVGIAQSSLQSYYKTSKDFGIALEGKVFPYFMSKNKLDGTLTQFEDSWEYAFTNDSGFRHIVFLLTGHITDSREIHKQSILTLHSLMGTVEAKFGSDGTRALERLFGYSALKKALKTK